AQAVNTARSYTAPVNAVRAKRVNVVKTSACWVWRPTKPNGASLRFLKDLTTLMHRADPRFIDSGCSRHMIGNIAYLSNFKEFDGGYVIFGGGAHGGRISGVTDDYSRFTWVLFLTTKDETSEILKNFIKEIENLVDKKVKIIRSDNGTEFKNKVMDDFCREKGIKREYSIAKTPQQNGVAERRNKTLIEAARTMLADSKLPTTFWAKVVSTACYVQNRVLVVKPHNKTPYELFRGFKPALSFMRPFGCHVTILNTLDNLGKFDGKSDEGFFVRYSLSSKAFRVYNTRTKRVEENLHIRFLVNNPMIEGNSPKWMFDIHILTQSMNYVPVFAGTISNESVG
ncbi:putative ribonuclease H-like domain-containing protein, partial [Tanacetum coccineum]